MKDRYEKYIEKREEYFRRIQALNRRDFMRASGVAAAGAAISGALVAPLLPARGRPRRPRQSFRFAYISDSHLYEKSLNERFVRSILKAVDDVNALTPQPDFILYGGDLAQLGQPKELEEGGQILKALKAPVRMMVGEHDWYLDMGEAWRKQFGKDTYSFDHKGVHFVVLNSRHRGGLLDGAEDDEHGAHAGHGPARQPERASVHGGRRPARLAEERPRRGRRSTPR